MEIEALFDLTLLCIIFFPLANTDARVDNQGDVDPGMIVAEQPIEAANPLVASVDVLAFGSNRNIVVHGLQIGSTLKFIRRKI